jgi:hypothetical protein
MCSAAGAPIDRREDSGDLNSCALSVLPAAANHDICACPGRLAPHRLHTLALRTSSLHDGNAVELPTLVRLQVGNVFSVGAACRKPPQTAPGGRSFIVANPSVYGTDPDTSIISLSRQPLRTGAGGDGGVVKLGRSIVFCDSNTGAIKVLCTPCQRCGWANGGCPVWQSLAEGEQL